MHKIIVACLIGASLAACSQTDSSDRRYRKERRQESGDNRGGYGARGGRLARLDTNDDGFVERSEAPERMQRRFDRLDADGDGKLSGDELASRRRR